MGDAGGGGEEEEVVVVVVVLCVVSSFSSSSKKAIFPAVPPMSTPKTPWGSKPVRYSKASKSASSSSDALIGLAGGIVGGEVEVEMRERGERVRGILHRAGRCMVLLE